jgi:hypothetical protein
MDNLDETSLYSKGSRLTVAKTSQAARGQPVISPSQIPTRKAKESQRRGIKELYHFAERLM